MIDLQNLTLSAMPASIKHPTYDRASVTAGIAHFSMGNFHRAHQAVYLDRCLGLPAHQGWGILAIGLMDDSRERDKATGMPLQNDLYTLTECPPDGEPTVSVIGSIVEYRHAPDDQEAVLARLADPAIRIVSMTVTEGGYNIDDATKQFRLDAPDVAHDLQNPTKPRTVFGFVIEALARRRAADIAPFTVLSCDNLRHNGAIAKLAFLSFARARDAALADWIETNVTFPGCMVDRITPATSPEDAKRLNGASGVSDRLPVFAEDFIQWVVEDKFCNGRPDLAAVGVTLTDNVDPYEQVKLRMLNASHMMLAFPGLLIGYRIAHEAMADANVHRLLNDFMEQDAAPQLRPIVPADLSIEQYRLDVLSRFGNRAIGDQLLRIASDGASKILVFMQDTLRTAIGQGGELRRLAFFLACFTRYFGGKDDRGESFPVVEPHMSTADLALAAQSGAAALQLPMFNGWGLAESPKFNALFTQYRAAIEAKGVKQVMADLLVETAH